MMGVGSSKLVIATKQKIKSRTGPKQPSVQHSSDESRPLNAIPVAAATEAPGAVLPAVQSELSQPPELSNAQSVPSFGTNPPNAEYQTAPESLNMPEEDQKFRGSDAAILHASNTSILGKVSPCPLKDEMQPNQRMTPANSSNLTTAKPKVRSTSSTDLAVEFARKRTPENSGCDLGYFSYAAAATANTDRFGAGVQQPVLEPPGDSETTEEKPVAADVPKNHADKPSAARSRQQRRAKKRKSRSASTSNAQMQSNQRSNGSQNNYSRQNIRRFDEDFDRGFAVSGHRRFNAKKFNEHWEEFLPVNYR